MEVLYRRNNFGEPTMWSCEVINNYTLVIKHGIISNDNNKKIITEYVNTKRTASDDCKSRYNAKRKAGYKFLSELKDDVYLPVEGELYNYLNTYLPYDRTTSDGSLLPMLAKVYDNTNNKLFNKCFTFIGQWKINGLRCFISAESNNDIFKSIKLKFQSREGTYWNSLSYLESYLLTVIPKSFLDKMVEEHFILDGELYLPNCTVNEINHIVKDATDERNKLIQYWCYDLAINNCSQFNRFSILHNNFNDYIINIVSKKSHINNTKQFVVLPIYDIYSDETAIRNRDLFIDYGFEGLILRNPNAEYQYGKRNSSMIKYKKSTDGKFIIVDIYPEGFKRCNIPLFLLKNDINDETFEVHVGGTQYYQTGILNNKEKYIGKLMYVEYGERSGVTQVPFHIKTTYIVNEYL